MAVLICLILLAGWGIDAHWRAELKASVRDSFLGQYPAQIEAEIRRSLPMGSSLETVEAVLSYGRFEQHYDSQTREVRAVAWNVKGSNWLIRDDLWITFHFDGNQRLSGIDATQHLTGP
jgi:hypothetical protein